MIKRQRGEFVATCDECGEVHYGGTEEDFRDFVSEIKEEGWEISKEEDQWVHHCPHCQD